jgi:hypothetical protein
MEKVPKRWLIIFSFTSRSRIVHLYWDITITYEALQNLGLSSALRDFEQGRIFIVSHLLLHGASGFPVSSKGPPIWLPFTICKGIQRTYSNPDPHGELEKVPESCTKPAV